jgi:hypothetical protein
LDPQRWCYGIGFSFSSVLPGSSVFQAGIVLIFVLSLAAELAAGWYDDHPTIYNIRRGVGFTSK